MSTINDTDLFVVERNGTLYKLAKSDMSTINDTDLFVVERGGSQYKVEAQYVNSVTGTMVSPVAVVTPLNGSGLSDGLPSEPVTSAITAVGGSGTYSEPAKTHGPYTYNSSSNKLTITGSHNFVVGEALEMTDANGTAATFTPTTTAITSISGNTVYFAAGNTALSNFSAGDTLTNSAAFSGTISGTSGSNLTALIDASGGIGYGPTTPTCGSPPVYYCDWGSRLTRSECISWNTCRIWEGNSVSTEVTFSTTGMSASTIKIPYWNIKTSSSNGATVTYTVTVGYWGGGTTTISNWTSTGSYSLDSSKSISSITFAGNMNGSDYAPEPTQEFKILLDDEVIITDSTTITIQSVDLANNSMTLDLNGFKVGQTISSSTSASGTGTISAINGNEITLSPDNGNWVDNYYATKPIGSPQAYDNLLTFSDDTNINLIIAPVEMTDASGAVKVPTTSAITNVNGNVLSLTDDTDLSYFNVGDVVQSSYAITAIGASTFPPTITVNGGTWATGDTVSTSSLTASSTAIIYKSGSQIAVNNTTGTYLTTLNLEGAQVTGTAPNAADIVFTSSNGGTTAYSGTASTLASRTWTLRTAGSANGPWSSTTAYIDTSTTSSQDGSTAWSTAPTLAADTFYQVKVRYDSENAEPLESTFNTFKTSA